MKCEWLVKDGARFLRRCKREATDVGPDLISHLCAWHCEAAFALIRASAARKAKALGTCARPGCSRFLNRDGSCSAHGTDVKAVRS